MGKFLAVLEDRQNLHKLSKEYQEAKAQNESKKRLGEELKRMFVDILDTEYIEKQVKTYKLDELNREIEVTTKKLKELKNKLG